MDVNSTIKGFFNNRWTTGFGIATFMLTIFFVASAFTKGTDHASRSKETNLLIRKIGHELLLQAGDRTSRVLPVTETEEGIFLLRFEHNFIFDHDSLMNLSQRLLSREQFPSGYAVTVHDCEKKADIIFGFQINRDAPHIQACSGRDESTGCYMLEFAFPDLYATQYDYSSISLMSSVAGLFALGLLIGRFRKKPLTIKKHNLNDPKESASESVMIGKFLFDIKNQSLHLNDEVIMLTDKECKILELLHANFGELTSRETLLQIWVDEGVITGRSLDMFVSKLRKKLSGDPELCITNVWGKGYKLELKG